MSAPIPSAVKAAAFGRRIRFVRSTGWCITAIPTRRLRFSYLRLNFSAPAGRTFSTDRAIGEGASGGAIVRGGKVVGIASARSGVPDVRSEVRGGALDTSVEIELTDPGAAPRNANRPPKAGRSKSRSRTTPARSQHNRIGLMAATKFTLSAKDVSDPDGDALTYIWDFGDGSAAPPSARRSRRSTGM